MIFLFKFYARVFIAILTFHSVEGFFKGASNTIDFEEKITIEIHLTKL